jgi:hypothetical protein
MLRRQTHAGSHRSLAPIFLACDQAGLIDGSADYHQGRREKQCLPRALYVSACGCLRRAKTLCVPLLGGVLAAAAAPAAAAGQSSPVTRSCHKVHLHEAIPRWPELQVERRALLPGRYSYSSAGMCELL